MPEPRDGMSRLFEVIDSPPRREFADGLRVQLLDAIGTAATATAVADRSSHSEHDPREEEATTMIEMSATRVPGDRRPWRSIAIATVAAAAAVAAAYLGVSRGERVETDRTPPATSPSTTIAQPKITDPDGGGPITATVGVPAVNVATGGDVVVASTRGKIIRLDRGTNEVLSETILENGGAIVAEGAIWAVDRSGTLHRLDATTLQTKGSLKVDGATGRRGGGAGSPLAFEGGRLWLVTGDALVGVDPSTLTVAVRTPIAGADDLTAGFGAVWVKPGSVDDPARSLVRVDAADGTVSSTLPLPGHAPRLAVGAGSVWVPDADHGDLLRIDPTTNKVTATIDVADKGTGAVAVSDTQVWVALFPKDAVVRIDPATNQVVERIDKVIGPSELSLADGVLWIASAEINLTRVDTGR